MKLDAKTLANKCSLAVKKYLPEILVCTGITCGVAGTVMACKATRKLDSVLDAHKENAEAVRQKYEKDMDNPAQKREITTVYMKTGMECAKLYGASFTMGVVSITSILASNNILRKRNVALAAAYAAIDTSFKQYRSRVVDRYSQEVDRELRFGAHQEKIEVSERDEDGKEKKVKKNVTVVDNPMPSDFARYFCYGEARAAEPNNDYNAFFLKAQQNLANTMLTSNGILFLNEVYDMLGIDRSLAGQSVGWVYDKNSEDHGDNYVDFRIQEVYRKKSDKPGDYEKVFLLDFNVDGAILEHSLDKGLITQ